jgi:fibronectin type 3 domain-containing protein/sarcosine oxidase gamma subunit
MVLRTVFGPPNSFFTYPHNNGFWRSDTVNWGPDTAVIATDLGAGNFQLSQFDPNTSRLAVIGQQAFLATTYFWDVATNGVAVVTDANSAALKWDLNTNTKSVLWSTTTDRVTGATITPDGTRVAFATQLIGSSGLDCSLRTVDVATLVAQELVHKNPFVLNHVHYSPFDPNWIQFSHEGDPVTIRDRMWGWHATLAPSPDGANIFPAAGGLNLQNDHERAMFHAAGSVVVAYGGNASSGVWEAYYNGTYKHTSTNHLGYDANHVDISRDGRWMVIDTTNVGGVSRVVAVNFATGAWQLLYTTSINTHPYHPHPVISPDNKWVFFNDYNLKEVVAIEIDQAQLNAFLGGIPVAPTGLTATAASSSQIDLSWTASSGAASYNVKRATVSGGPYTTIATGVTATSYSDTALAASTAFYYVVSAVNTGGESPNSAQASATTLEPPPPPPPAPTGLTATAASSSQINLSWTASSGATSYKVKQATVSGGPYTTIATGVTATTYSATNLTGSTTYYYVVSAVNAGGESPNSAQASATTPADTSTAFITGQTLGTLRNDLNNWVGCRFAVGATAITVTDLGRWVVAGNSGTHTIKLVNQATGVDVAGASVTVNTSGAPAGAFRYASLPSAVTLTANTTYYLVSQETLGGDQFYGADSTVTTTSVGTMNKAARFDGTSWFVSGNLTSNTYGPSNFKYQTGAPPPPPPAAPTGLTATAASSSQINLGWTSSSGATSYNVKRATVSGGPYTTITTGVATVTYNDTGLAASTTYYYVVSAVNAGGESADSAQASATTNAPPTNTPFITGQTLGTLRNDVSNWVGCRFAVGTSAITVKELGRWVVAGNSGTHAIKLVNQATGVDVAGGSVTVNTAGAPTGAFVYATLSSPVTLSANTTYYLVSQETAGGDQWYGADTTVTTTSVGSMNKAARFDGTSWFVSGNLTSNTYGPSNFKY